MISKKVVLPVVFSAPFIFFFVLCIAVIMTISRENHVGDDFIGGGDGEYET
ncbi:endopeptidase, partial [Bacillus subtilis]|nr:endopeptidase [Bacillus subtilis]